MPYIARNGYLLQKESIGNGQCVALVRELTGARPSSLWREGRSLQAALAAGDLPEGAAIATFHQGRYRNLPSGNHAAVFVRKVPGGVEIFDQWHRHKPSKRTIYFKQDRAGVAQQPEKYSVIE
jgi:hypothetical protein